jgi:hypothetical protein
VLSAKICFSHRWGGDNLPIEKKRLPTLVRSFYALNRGQDMPEVTIVAECGTGKTLISLGAVAGHARGRQYTAIVVVVMMPPGICLSV